MKYLYPLLVMLFFPLLQSCNNSNEASDTEESGIEASTEIIISKQQFESGGMNLGDPTPHVFQQSIKANGYVAPSMSGWAKVSVPIPGRVKEINFKLGDPIYKGQLLFSVESNEIIMLQQQYAEFYTQLKAVEKSYDRQKTLSEEKVTSKKDFLQAESDYKGILSKVEGLKAQLKMINIDPQKVEDGRISSSASVYAPIKGFVTESKLVLGQFIGPEDLAIELIDTDLLQLNIHLFERDLTNIVAGQTVVFYDPNNMDQMHQAVLIQVGKSINSETKTVQCIAQITSKKEGFINGVFVEVEIVTCKREALAIPKEAFIEEDGFFYLLVLQSSEEGNMYFKKAPVNLGLIQNGFGEIVEEGLKDILLEGGYNILSQE